MNNNIFQKIDNAMMEELEELRKHNASEKEFNLLKEKARTVALLADKIIQSQVAQLKMDVWQHSKHFDKRKATALANASYVQIEQDLDYDN